MALNKRTFTGSSPVILFKILGVTGFDFVRKMLSYMHRKTCGRLKTCQKINADENDAEINALLAQATEIMNNADAFLAENVVEVEFNQAVAA